MRRALQAAVSGPGVGMAAFGMVMMVSAAVVAARSFHESSERTGGGMATETKGSTRERVEQVIRSEIGTDAEIGAETRMEDLGADLLDMVEIVMGLEEEFLVDITDEDAEQVKTVADAVQLVERLQYAP